MAQTSAAIYHMPYEPLFEQGKLRAAAMQIRDSQVAADGVTEQDWSEIGSLLDRSWRSLWQAVNASKPVGGL